MASVCALKGLCTVSSLQFLQRRFERRGDAYRARGGTRLQVHGLHTPELFVQPGQEFPKPRLPRWARGSVRLSEVPGRKRGANFPVAQTFPLSSSSSLRVPPYTSAEGDSELCQGRLCHLSQSFCLSGCGCRIANLEPFFRVWEPLTLRCPAGGLGSAGPAGRAPARRRPHPRPGPRLLSSSPPNLSGSARPVSKGKGPRSTAGGTVFPKDGSGFYPSAGLIVNQSGSISGVEADILSLTPHRTVVCPDCDLAKLTRACVRWVGLCAARGQALSAAVLSSSAVGPDAFNWPTQPDGISRKISAKEL
uniref:uncharacterized protein LOC129517837 n=1 Tax=Nyctereutes procyonoides TaxID=34880 RepID=UPI00244454B4|nr:uncharacterized protein LOC129517837 [Nyctereutes procyonoides]